MSEYRRESQRWTRLLDEGAGPPAACQWIFIADGEADFYEPIQICQQHRIDFVIRARHDRRLAGEAGHLREALAQAPVVGQTTVEVRARPGQSARTAIVEVRRVQIDLDGPWRLGGWQPALLGLKAVEVREVHGARRGQGAAALGVAVLVTLSQLGGGAAGHQAVCGPVVDRRVSQGAQDARRSPRSCSLIKAMRRSLRRQMTKR